MLVVCIRFDLLEHPIMCVADLGDILMGDTDDSRVRPIGITVCIALGYVFGWALGFPLVVVAGLAVGAWVRQRSSAAKRLMTPSAAAFVVVGLLVQVVAVLSMCWWIRVGPLTSYHAPLWSAVVSASAPSLWEKAVHRKILSVQRGQDRFPWDDGNRHYSLGPDGTDQQAQLLYDPSNGVVSLGDIIIETRRNSAEVSRARDHD